MNISIQTSPLRVDVFGDGFDFSIGWGGSSGAPSPEVRSVFRDAAPASVAPSVVATTPHTSHPGMIAAFRGMISSVCNECVDEFAKVVEAEQARRQANMS